jgi:hypothetical protein
MDAGTCNAVLVRVHKFACASAVEILALSAGLRASSVVLPTLHTGRDFLVTVADRGGLVSGLRLQVAGTKATTNKDGVAAFKHIAPGQYVVMFDHDDGVSDSVNLNVKANGPRNVSVHLRWPSVSAIQTRSLKGSLNLAEPPTEVSSLKFRYLRLRR